MSNDVINGGTGDDIAYGGPGDDTIYGGTGNDLLYGEAGSDSLLGEEGNDTLFGGAGADTMNGGSGLDVLSYAGSTAGAVRILVYSQTGEGGDAEGDVFSSIERVIGTDFDDQFVGAGDRNIRMDGANGNDRIVSVGRADILDGGNGNDTLIAQGGDDYLAGGNGLDSLDGGDGNDTVFGGNNDDFLTGGSGADLVDGGAGLDTMSYAGSSAAVQFFVFNGSGLGGDAEGDVVTNVERVIGSAFNDRFVGAGNVNIRMDGADGDDRIVSVGRSDILDGGNGSDTLIGQGGDDFLAGGSGNDELSDGDGLDSVFGGLGDDTIYAGAGADQIDGGSGVDLLSYVESSAGVQILLFQGTGTGGFAQGDTISGIEVLTGSSFDDVLVLGGASTVRASGGDGNDRIVSLGLADTLNGGLGNDTLIGQGGVDLFEFAIGSGNDTIVGFDVSSEKIRLSNVGTDFDTFAEVDAVITQVGSDALINFGGSSILLEGVNELDLSISHFEFT